MSEEIHDCSNCWYRKDVAPYNIILGCTRDNTTHSPPYTCDKWSHILDHLGEEQGAIKIKEV